jgi:hypothetical protein
MAGLKQIESFRDSFRQLKILTAYWLYIRGAILHAKEKCNCVVNEQVHTVTCMSDYRWSLDW